MAIVCGTDFSANTAPAIATAAAVAERMGEPLWLVHALDPTTATLNPPTVMVVERAIVERLEEEAGRLRGRLRTEVNIELLRGVAHRALLEFAERKAAKLVVVASQGHGSSPLYRLGGTSERLTAGSRLPVLVAHDAAPFEAWARGERALRIVIGVDESVSSEGALQWVKGLRRAGPCDVTASTVYYAPEAWRRYGIAGKTSWVEPDPEVERLLARDLAARLGELPGEGAVVFRPTLGLGRMADHLLEVADEAQADLIVVGTHHRRGLARLSSVSSGVIHMAKMSVACIPTSDDAPRMEGLPQLQRVLIPTDLSPRSNLAVPYGCALLGHGGGDLHLLYVAPPKAGASAPGEPQTEAELASRMNALVPEVAARAGVRVHPEVVHGREVARLVCESAERLAVDAICMTSRSRSEVEKLVLGSVTEEVLKQSRRPVLVLRPPQA